MEYHEPIYKILCGIARKCRKYFYIHKYMDFDSFGKDKLVDEILEDIEKLEKLRKEQKEKYE